jgi:tetratricopeptide (TPR) repeat protein
MQDAFDWNEEPPFDPAIEYQGLLRGLRRKKGFGLYFVQCSPAEGTKLIERVREDLPQKIEVLKFDAAMDGNFYQCVADYLQVHGDTEVLFVQGLEYSLLSYEAAKREEGWSSEEIYSYSWKAVPRLLGNLNLQRERFRDNFPIRFVFLLPLFAMKYLIRRAPDFFDWRSGVYEFPSDSELLEKESLRILQEANFSEYLNWTQPERDRRISEIKCWIEEPGQITERKAQLSFDQANLFYASKKYEAVIASYDQALKYKPDDDAAWYFRGIALGNLQRYEEAIASLDQALEIKPDDSAWVIRGALLLVLGRYEEAIASYDQALKVNPNSDDAIYRKAHCYGLQNQVELAIAHLKQAIALNPKYREMAKTDADFDKVRGDDRFQALLDEVD